jgi:hypothetical protein
LDALRQVTGKRKVMTRRIRILVLTAIVGVLMALSSCVANNASTATPSVNNKASATRPPVNNKASATRPPVNIADNSTNVSLNLPRIPWEGGPAYWNMFQVAKAAGWTNPKFFPIVIWYDGVSSNSEVRADESYGINTYIGQPASTNYKLFADNNAFILSALNNAPVDGTAQPGRFLVDEPDGRDTSAIDLRIIENLVASSPNDGTFKEINCKFICRTSISG